ncbi:hypothetical protein [Pseudomonas sp. TMP25]|uniref:hypothetical protein n=1 Tax=Pseudomonas sp. TMP25 TaxID=3136561 RepID=UPI0031015617
MAKERAHPKFTVNMAAIELAYSPGVPELLERGTAREVRQALSTIAHLLTQGRAGEIGPITQSILGEALGRIGQGDDPNKALGLNRKKKYGAWYAKQLEWLIQDLMRQGLTRTEAEDVMGRLDFKKLEAAKETFALDDYESADEKLRKRLTRAKTK